MANELSLTVTAVYTPSTSGLSKVSPPTFSKTVTMTSQKYVTGTQEIGTSEEALSFGDVTNGGYLVIKNIDATNFVELNQETPSAKYSIRLKAGEFSVFRIGGGSSNAMKAKADTAACTVEYYLFSD